MYVHIGSDRIVRLCDIVGIFDLDGEITTEDTGEFLKGADAAGITSLPETIFPVVRRDIPERGHVAGRAR